MSAQTIQMVQTALEAFNVALGELNKAKLDYAHAEAEAIELRRQYDYHVAHGDQTNANIVLPALNQADSNVSILKNAVIAAQKKHDDALATYTNLKNTLLTEAEKEALAKAEAAKANYASKSTKFWIIGGIIIIILAFGVWIYVRNRNKAA
jgi:hypothetical protein